MAGRDNDDLIGCRDSIDDRNAILASSADLDDFLLYFAIGDDKDSGLTTNSRNGCQRDDQAVAALIRDDVYRQCLSRAEPCGLGCRDEADLHRAAVSIHLRTDFGHFGIKCLTRECITADLCQLTNIDLAKVDFIEVDANLRALGPDKPDDRLIWTGDTAGFCNDFGDGAIKWRLYTGIGNPAARDAKRTLRIHQTSFRHRNRLLRFAKLCPVDKNVLTLLRSYLLRLAETIVAGSNPDFRLVYLALQFPFQDTTKEAIKVSLAYIQPLTLNA